MSSMSKQEVKCRSCGHRILAREIMRTDLYERAPGQNYVYVKFRCRRCKRMGQTFVPEARWDWTLLEPARDELSEPERDRLSEAGPISDTELLDFHVSLKSLEDITSLRIEPVKPEEGPTDQREANSDDATGVKPEENRREERSNEPRETRQGTNPKNSNEPNGSKGEKQPDDCGNNRGNSG